MQHVVEPLTEMPEIPTRMETRTFFIAGIFFLMLLAALHTASEIAIPFFLALILKFFFHPALRRMERFGIPRSLASIFIIMTLLGVLAGIGTALADPVSSWGARLPASYSKLQDQLRFLQKPVEKTQKILLQADSITQTDSTKKVVAVVEGTRISDRFVGGTQALAGGMFTTLLILLFLLSAGDTFLRRFVEVLPRFRDKRQAVDISLEIERDISRYLMTITGMNLAVGVGTGIVMYLFHIEDPVLWGCLAFLLNYIPIIGPFVGISLFFMAALITTSDLGHAALPAFGYFVIHIIEGSFITPMLLARRFTLNPVLIIVSLIFWYWMWGVTGAILAMPMLAIFKIMCDRIERLTPLGHMLEG